MQTIMGPMPESARDAASRLRLAAAAAGDAARLLDAGSGPSSPRWAGRAAEAHYRVRQGLRARASSVETATAGAAAVLAEYAARMQELVARERAAVREIDAAEEEVRAGVPALPGGVPARERAAAARARLDEVIAAAEDAASVAAAAMGRIRDDIADRPLTAYDHTGAGIGRAWRDAVVQPLTDLWGVTGLVATDRAGWWENVSGVPGGLWAQVRHPLDTAKTWIAWEEWTSDRQGEAGGAVLALIAPGKIASVSLHKDNGANRFPHNMADKNAPLPVRQSLAEMFQQVDLSRHEHHDLGHALRRHVNVSDNYLSDRMRNGTLEDDGKRGGIPPAASAWNNIDTANRVTTQVLNMKRAEVQAFAAGRKNVIFLEVPIGGQLGRILSGHGANQRWSTGGTAKVGLQKDGNGDIFILTAYVVP